jgi:hypothetical protein
MLTSAAISQILGVHKGSINRIAKLHGLGKTVGNMRVFTQSDVKMLRKLCRKKRGNPNFKKSSE